jgi:hypothetical protein
MYGSCRPTATERAFHKANETGAQGWGVTFSKKRQVVAGGLEIGADERCIEYARHGWKLLPGL